MKTLLTIALAGMIVAPFAVAGQGNGRKCGRCCNGCEMKRQRQSQTEETAKATKPQQFCPVMDKTVNDDLYVVHQGKKIKVCCTGCIGTVKANPGKYAAELEAKGIELEPVKPAEE